MSRNPPGGSMKAGKARKRGVPNATDVHEQRDVTGSSEARRRKAARAPTKAAREGAIPVALVSSIGKGEQAAAPERPVEVTPEIVDGLCQCQCHQGPRLRKFSDIRDYIDGEMDFEAGRPPPPVTSTPYDLGRACAEDMHKRFAHMPWWIEECRENSRRWLANRQAMARERLAFSPEAQASHDAIIRKEEERRARRALEMSSMPTPGKGREGNRRPRKGT